jgi:hypothetical protein
VRRPQTSAALAACALLAGCASGSTHVGSQPLCRAGDDEVGPGVILMAQSVPSATRVPCIGEALPLGWAFDVLDARNGNARFWLDSDRDGTHAVEVRLEPACDTTGAVEIPSDREGVRRLERVRRVDPTYAGERFYRFEGGCLTFVFALQSGSAGEALAVASEVVDLVPREVLAAQVREESGGRLSLDPPGGGEG